MLHAGGFRLFASSQHLLFYVKVPNQCEPVLHAWSRRTLRGVVRTVVRVRACPRVLKFSLMCRSCRACVQGYYRSGQDCVVCPAMAVYYLLMFVAALLAAGFLAAWMQRSGVNLKGNDVWEVRVLRCLHSECVRVTFDSAPAIILRLTMTDAGISVGVDFLQTLSMFKSFAFAWPSLINTTLAATAASTFNIDLVSPECTITITFVRKWVILQVFPVICGACLIVGIVTSTLVVELRSMWQQRARPDARQTLCRRSAWRSAQDNIVGGIFTVAYYMCAAAASVRARNTAGVHQRSVCCRRYFMVVRQALEIFVCSAAPNGGYVLTSDPSIACWAPGSEQAGLVPYAALSLLAYGCGIPIAFMIAIRRNKEGIRRDQQLWLMGRGAEALDNLDFRVRARYARLYQGWWRTPPAMQLELEIFVLLPYVLRLGNLMAFSIRMSRYCRLGQCFEVVAGAHSRVCARMDEKCLVYCWGLGIKSLVCVVSHSTVYFVFVFVFSSMCARMALHCGKNPRSCWRGRRLRSELPLVAHRAVVSQDVHCARHRSRVLERHVPGVHVPRGALRRVPAAGEAHAVRVAQDTGGRSARNERLAQSAARVRV